MCLVDHGPVIHNLQVSMSNLFGMVRGHRGDPIEVTKRPLNLNSLPSYLLIIWSNQTNSDLWKDTEASDDIEASDDSEV